MIESGLKKFLDQKVKQYEKPPFIKDDPICIPHRFSQKQDIEIAGFFAAILAWGNRKSIINSCNRLLAGMDDAPYDFILNFRETDLRPFAAFAHRTFNATDLFHFLDFLQNHYRNSGSDSLEQAFSKHLGKKDDNVGAALTGFYNAFFDEDVFPDYPRRTRKHIATPFKKSACKRLNMFLRWMVRSNAKGVDFGIWNTINPSQLVCPLDVHVARVAKHFNLMQRPGSDWLAALELTKSLKMFDPRDPVKYDFALFGLGVIERF